MVLTATPVGVIKKNFRRVLLTLEALSELGPAITADRDFSETAPMMLASLLETVDALEGALFRFTERPAMLSSVAATGFSSFPHPAVIPLLPKHVHTLTKASGPRILTPTNRADFLTNNGNIGSESFCCLIPLRAKGKLVGAIALGRREEGAEYLQEELDTLGLLAHYVSLALHNHSMSEALAQRVSENLKLMATVHSFYDTTLEAFAAAIDFKHVNIHGHSLRVGRYAAGIAEAMGTEQAELAGLRASGYLHDVGQVVVDKRLFSKPTALDANEFREMADHTVLGHEIVKDINFPWPAIPDVVRWHHERLDGSGYPDKLKNDEIPAHARIVAVADSFDAMMSERPYRHSMTLAAALNELVRLAPTKLDPNAVQALLIQVRRDAVANSTPQLPGHWATRKNEKPSFLDEHVYCNLGPNEVDQIASLLQHKITNGRTYAS